MIKILPPAASDNSTHSANHCTSASGSTSVVSRPLEWHTWKWVRKWGVRPPVMFAPRPTLMLNNYASILLLFPTCQQPTKKKILTLREGEELGMILRSEISLTAFSWSSWRFTSPSFFIAASSLLIDFTKRFKRIRKNDLGSQGVINHTWLSFFCGMEKHTD